MKKKKIISCCVAMLVVIACVSTVMVVAFADNDKTIETEVEYNFPSVWKEDPRARGGLKVFSYELKSQYSSRAEIVAELNHIGTSFKEDAGEIDETYEREQYEKMRIVRNELREKLKEFPPSAEEEQRILLDKYNAELEFWDEQVLWIKLDKSGFAEEWEKEKAKENNKICLEVDKKFKKGELTLQEAYDQVEPLKIHEPVTYKYGVPSQPQP